MLSGSWRQFAVLVSHVIIRAGDILGRCIIGNHPREPLTHNCIIRSPHSPPRWRHDHRPVRTHDFGTCPPQRTQSSASTFTFFLHNVFDSHTTCLPTLTFCSSQNGTLMVELSIGCRCGAGASRQHGGLICRSGDDRCFSCSVYFLSPWPRGLLAKRQTLFPAGGWRKTRPQSGLVTLLPRSSRSSRLNGALLRFLHPTTPEECGSLTHRTVVAPIASGPSAIPIGETRTPIKGATRC